MLRVAAKGIPVNVWIPVVEMPVISVPTLMSSPTDVALPRLVTFTSRSYVPPPQFGIRVTVAARLHAGERREGEVPSEPRTLPTVVPLDIMGSGRYVDVRDLAGKEIPIAAVAEIIIGTKAGQRAATTVAIVHRYPCITPPPQELISLMMPPVPVVKTYQSALVPPVLQTVLLPPPVAGPSATIPTPGATTAAVIQVSPCARSVLDHVSDPATSSVPRARYFLLIGQVLVERFGGKRPGK